MKVGLNLLDTLHGVLYVHCDTGFMSGSDALASSAYQKIERIGSARSSIAEGVQERQDCIADFSRIRSLQPLVPLREMPRLEPWEAEKTEKRHI